MWTVEEDLLILQLYEQYGKRWSKIASHLPGRTDNGVRNRWNRMERAQVLRKSRLTSGYRCRRCGEPKRGHICAARTLHGGDEVPEDEEAKEALHIKAAALTEFSAKALQTAGEELPSVPDHEVIDAELVPDHEVPSVLQPGVEPAIMATNTFADHTPPPTPIPTRSASPTFSFKQPTALTGCLSLTRFSSKGDFLDELRHSLDDAMPVSATSAVSAPVALQLQISNNTLQCAFTMLANTDWEQYA